MSARVLSVRLRDFRSYESAEIAIGDGLTVITGSNGAGKTNLIEALYFGCTGRSCRTSNEREVVRFGAQAARVVLATEGEDGAHELSVGFQPGEPKRMRADGAPVERLLDVPDRPLVSVFLPDRLELIKGAPALRRGHLDAFVAALWPARVQTRRAYAQALAQRNALLARLRTGAGRAQAAATLASWDLQLARHGLALMADRAEAVGSIDGAFARLCEELGLDGDPAIRYRPRSRAGAAEELVAELADRVDADLERGFTGHGPHRDDVATLRAGRELRAYGSQGQQRLALLAWLLAERSALAERRTAPPVMLLDDVMSELDARRRRALVDLLREGGGQSIITATDAEQVPGSAQVDVHRIEVAAGGALQQTPVGDSARVGA
ncbi:MAG TPA: DNA replication and repair protein RecF [Solirubrobacteraceae bacterium]|nr:DNA replication and repair protein RecF [Solirubrobacteraceae bacterium]